MIVTRINILTPLPKMGRRMTGSVLVGVSAAEDEKKDPEPTAGLSEECFKELSESTVTL